jgi:hypothetical protein
METGEEATGRTEAVEEVLMDELRRRGKVIDHPVSADNELYAGMGRPCPYCKKAWFCSKHDLKLHIQKCRGPQHYGWRKSKFDNGEILPSDKDPELKLEIQKSGPIQLGAWRYSLSQDGKWLKRRLEEVKE